MKLNYTLSQNHAILCISEEKIQTVYLPNDRYGCRQKGYKIKTRKDEVIEKGEWVYISRQYKNFLSKPTIMMNFALMMNLIPYPIELPDGVTIRDIHLYRLSTSKPEPPFISHYNDFVWCYTDVSTLLKRFKAFYNYFDIRIFQELALQDIYLAVTLIISNTEVNDTELKLYDKICKVYTMAINPGTIYEGKTAANRCIVLCKDFLNSLNYFI